MAFDLAYSQPQRFFVYDDQPLASLPNGKLGANTLSNFEKLFTTNNLDRMNQNENNFEKVFRHQLFLQKRPILQQWGPNGSLDFFANFFSPIEFVFLI